MAEWEAGPALDMEIARQVFNYPGLGYYGPPTDGSLWEHAKPVRYDTPEEARASYRQQWATRTEGEQYGKATPDNAMFDNLLYWEDGWGPRYVGDFSTDAVDAMELLEQWDGDYQIRRQNGHWQVTLYQPSQQWEAWGDTLPLAICRARLRAATATVPA